MTVGVRRVKNLEPTKELLEKFWARVEKGPECWIWRGAKAALGYGQFFETRYRAILAHRLSWNVAHGAIPEGMGVLHRCDNPPCVRPEHLFLGGQSANMMDASRKGRLPRHGVCGEDNSFAKLTNQQRTEIVLSNEMHKVLAARYNIGRPAITKIKKKWPKHMEGRCGR